MSCLQDDRPEETNSQIQSYGAEDELLHPHWFQVAPVMRPSGYRLRETSRWTCVRVILVEE
jgi:hypothetical protein